MKNKKYTEVKQSRYIYHTSNPIFRDRIKIEGLIPKGRSENWLLGTDINKNVIFLVNDNEKGYVWDSTYDDDIYRIDTKGLNKKFYQDPNFEDKIHLIFFDKIPVNNIELIYKGSYCF